MLAHDLHEFFRSFSTRLALARFRVRCKEKDRTLKMVPHAANLKIIIMGDGSHGPTEHGEMVPRQGVGLKVEPFFFLKRNGAFD